MLIAFSGRPGVGKTTISRELAERIGAMHLRIDRIEQTLRDLGLPVTRDEGYRVGYALAEDNLKLGRTVIADSVNPIIHTREAWRIAAEHAQAPFLNVEVICSDQEEHRRRVETRASDIPNLVLPTWEETLAREIEPWRREHLLLDSAKLSLWEAVEQLEWAITRAKAAPR